MLLWHLLLKTRLETFQALNIWIIIEINVIRGYRWNSDEQFSNCGWWCTSDLWSTLPGATLQTFSGATR